MCKPQNTTHNTKHKIASNTQTKPDLGFKPGEAKGSRMIAYSGLLALLAHQIRNLKLLPVAYHRLLVVSEYFGPSGYSSRTKPNPLQSLK